MSARRSITGCCGGPSNAKNGAFDPLDSYDTEREVSGRQAADLNLELPTGFRYVEPDHVKP